jgi:hypothetical protein
MVPKNNSGIEINSTNPININVATPSIFAELRNFTNMLRLDTVNQAGGDILIYIDDTAIQFKTGQVIRLTFNNNLNIGSRNIRVYTDAPNRLNGGSYGKLIANITNDQISTRPIVDIICTEQGVLNFVYDVIK